MPRMRDTPPEQPLAGATGPPSPDEDALADARGLRERAQPAPSDSAAAVDALTRALADLSAQNRFLLAQLGEAHARLMALTRPPGPASTPPAVAPDTESTTNKVVGRVTPWRRAARAAAELLETSERWPTPPGVDPEDEPDRFQPSADVDADTTPEPKQG